MKAKKWMILLALAPLALAGCEDPGKEDASSTDPNSTLSASSSPASHGGSSSIQEDKSESLSSRPEETGSSSSSILPDPVTSGSSSIPDSEPDPEPPLEEPQEIDASAQDIADKFLEIYEARQYRVTHTIGGVEYVDYYTPRYITNEAKGRGYVMLESWDRSQTQGYKYVVYEYFENGDGTIDVGSPAIIDGGYYITYVYTIDQYNPMAWIDQYRGYGYWDSSAFTNISQGYEGIWTLNTNNSGSSYIASYLFDYTDLTGCHNMSFHIMDDGSFRIDYHVVATDPSTGAALTDENGAPIVETAASVLIDGIGTAESARLEERFAGGKYLTPTGSLFSKMYDRPVSFLATYTLNARDGSEDPEIQGKSRVVYGEDFESYQVLNEDGSLNYANNYFKGTDDSYAYGVTLNAKNEVVWDPVTDDNGRQVYWYQAATDLRDYINSEDLSRDPTDPTRYTYVSADSDTFIDVVSLFNVSWGLSGRIELLTLHAPDGVIESIDCRIVDEMMLNENYYYNIHVEIEEEAPVVEVPTALEPIEGVTEAVEEAVAKLDGATALRIERQSLNSSSGEYVGNRAIYWDPVSRSQVTETLSNGKRTAATGLKEDGAEGMIPFSISNNAAVATGPNQEGTYESTLDFTPSALIFQEGAEEGTYVIRPEIDKNTLSSVMAGFDSIYSGEDLVFTIEDGAFREVTYSYDSGYFGVSYYRFLFSYGADAAIDEAYYGSILALIPFVIPDSWRAWWASRTSGTNYFQNMLNYFLQNDNKYPTATPSGLTEEEAEERLDAYVPFVYHEKVTSYYVTLSNQEAAQGDTVNRRFYMSFYPSITSTYKEEYYDLYLAKIQELGYRKLDKVEDADEIIYSYRINSTSTSSYSAVYEQWKSADGEVVLEVQTNLNTSLYVYVYDLTKGTYTNN